MLGKINVQVDSKQHRVVRWWLGVGFGVLGLIAATSVPAVATPGTVVLATDPTGGLCGFPGGDVAMPAILILARGTLFVVGMAKVATRGGGGDGDYGVSSSRKALVAGLGIAALGILLPEVASYILEMFGTSSSEMGLECAL